ncbi:hypothetical protein ACHAQH_003307 [Verticillium albo-atrum]
MFLQRSVITAARRAAVAPMAKRAFTTSFIQRDAVKSATAAAEVRAVNPSKTFAQIKSEDDLIGAGAKAGTIPTDLEQSTGLERLEILGKMEGVDIFDMRPLDASRTGTMENPINVRSAGDEQYLGCTGSPADSHVVKWLTISRERPIERCPECGSVYNMEYVGPQDDGHGHHDHHHGHEDVKTFADFIKPEYRYQ